MIEDLNIGNRVRMAQLSGHITVKPNEYTHGYLRRSKPDRKTRRLLVKVTRYLGSILVRVGRRLERYEADLAIDSEGLGSAKAQVN